MSAREVLKTISEETPIPIIVNNINHCNHMFVVIMYTRISGMP